MKISGMLQFNYNDTDGSLKEHTLKAGEVIFVVGANGVGKSSLMQRLVEINQDHSKRISAHRRTWLASNALSLTARDKIDIEKQMSYSDKESVARWSDHYAEQRSNIAIYELIEAENVRAREIAKLVDGGNLEEAENKSNTKSPLATINELMKMASLPIEISISNDNQLFANKNGSDEYSIAEMSDGERNTLLIASAVLTAKPGSLLLVDEPERHLHRSIISPLLSSLFQRRKDCAFVISTHDISLPQDNPEANVLLIRDCQWSDDSRGRENKVIDSWDTDFISANDNIPSDVKHQILGGKRKLLFVEGDDKKSLDKQLYQLLFPTVSIIPCGSCAEVKNKVQAIQFTESVGWIEAFGLIDADDRTDDDISYLASQNIFAIPYYSVESLYYHPNIIGIVATHVLTEDFPQDLVSTALEAALTAISSHKRRLCARRCERVIRSKYFESIPNQSTVQSEDLHEVVVDIKSVRDKEYGIFDGFVSDGNIEGLICRYPVRETQALTEIAKKLGYQSAGKYESAVRTLVTGNDTANQVLKELLGDLTLKIESHRTTASEGVAQSQ
ncbi:AAA family ATPase [Tunicatimonas pelagia]|uniref:AAA family ATPase n=1 Tax=Tunicatimonas pelagia TaxID=931531 RepID=UPI002667161F|nr:AAA family ATPase [Tunicatimonas pelagia]WKN45884.1 AAA family ATPase [Tunicatimonas pelagia]